MFPTTFGVTDKVFPLIETFASELFTISKFDNNPFVSVKVVVSPIIASFVLLSKDGIS